MKNLQVSFLLFSTWTLGCPRMCQRYRNFHAIGLGNVKHAAKERAQRWRKPRLQNKRSRNDGGDVCKREISHQHQVQNNAQRPHVHFWSRIALPQNLSTKSKNDTNKHLQNNAHHFWGSVCRSSAKGVLFRSALNLVGQTKINQFHLIMFFSKKQKNKTTESHVLFLHRVFARQHNVFALDVSVHISLRMQIVDCVKQLHEKSSCNVLGQTVVQLDQIAQLSTCDIYIYIYFFFKRKQQPTTNPNQA
jgi:hypothetical protein